MSDSVVSLEYDEKKGTLDVKYYNGGILRFYLVTPQVYEKHYNFKSLSDFVSKVLVGQFVSVPID